jgi:hypothetical protein
MEAADASGLCGRSTAVPDVLAALAAVAPWIAAALLPAVPQWPSYHDFADQRAWVGVPHALNVLSNLPLLAVGALGLAHLRRTRAPRSVAVPYGVFFAGALLTAFGSAWYHADPRDATLVWDRLPIALAFAGLSAGTLADRAPGRAMPYSVGLSAIAVATVLVWHWSGDLLPYLVMQAGFVAAALVAAATLRSAFTHGAGLYAAAAVYALAFACERLDKPIAAWFGGEVSGHTLKHLLAAAAIAVVLAMLRRRRAAPQ